MFVFLRMKEKRAILVFDDISAERQSRRPFPVNILKYSIKINCLENTSFLLVDWWTTILLKK